jgi:hypothetical protein
MPEEAVFVTKSREELVQLVQNMGRRLSGLSRTHAPIIISVGGDYGSGKSLVWDVLKDTVLDQNQTRIPTDLPRLFAIRDGERWEGQNATTGLKHTFLFYNMRNKDFEDAKEPIRELARAKRAHPQSAADHPTAKSLGADFILLSNTKAPSDIKIVVDYDADIPLRDWKRTTKIAIENPGMTDSGEFNDFLVKEP